MNLPSGLRVGVDGFNLALRQGTGVATYARTLVAALGEAGRRVDLIYGLDVPASAPPALRETLFFSALAEGRSGNEPPERITRWGRLRRRFLSARTRDLVEVPLAGRVVRLGEGARLPACARLFTCDRLFFLGGRYLRRFGRVMPVRVPDPPAIMHWTYPVPVRLIGSRNVYTIHDLVPLRQPYLSREDKAYHARLLEACIAAATHLVTVSEASRREILAHLPVDPARLTNTYQALPAPVTPLDTATLATRLRALFGLEAGRYLLFHGAIEPKKNLARLIEAYLTADLTTPLVLAGPEGWDARDALQLLDRAGPAAARVRRLGYLPEAQLSLLVQGARAALFPSLAEGFGLPALAAMRAGVPLVASDAGALPELVGDAALLVDPYDVDAIRAALVAIDTDSQLRARLAAAGPPRAQAFAMAPYRARLDALHARLLSISPGEMP